MIGRMVGVVKCRLLMVSLRSTSTAMLTIVKTP